MVDFCRRKFIGILASLLAFPRLVFGRGRGRYSGLNLEDRRGHGKKFILPTDLVGCKLYLRGDKGLTVGAKNVITQWDDQSGQNNHMTPQIPPDLRAAAWVSGSFYGIAYTVAHSGSFWSSDTSDNITEPGVSGWTNIDADTAQVYAAGTTYNTGDHVLGAGSTWRSLVDANTGQTLEEGANWEETTAVQTKEVATGLNGLSTVDFILNRANNLGRRMEALFSSPMLGDGYTIGVIKKTDVFAEEDKGGDYVLDGLGARFDIERLTLAANGSEGATTTQVAGTADGMSTSNVDTASWQSFIWTEAASREFWLDGVSVDTDISNSPKSKIRGICLGDKFLHGDNKRNWFDGEIAAVFVFDRKLNPAEIAALYAGEQAIWGI